MPYNIPGAPAPFFAAIDDKLSATAVLAVAGRYPRVPVTLLTDNLAQDLRRDAVPRLNLFDRSKLIRRRLQQAFPQARLSASVNLKSDRKQVLLAGLHNGGAIFDWMARLASVNPNKSAAYCCIAAGRRCRFGRAFTAAGGARLGIAYKPSGAPAGSARSSTV